jgi:anti-sigma regulatory factor (Ser/Thr protein kinase)
MTPTLLRHDAMFYSGDGEYVARVREFVLGGLEAGGGVLVAVPEPKLALLQDSLSGVGGDLHFVDMRLAGVNPARIIPFIKAFVDEHPDLPVRFVGEPIWAGRSEAETVEAVRHEGLINEAFGATDVHILCPYDVRDLTSGVLDDARRTHPTIWDNGERFPCRHYADPLEIYAAVNRPLPEPSVVPLRVSVTEGLASFRSTVKERARSADLAPDRVAGFLLAANEAATNTLVHAGGDGSARIWHDENELVCEVSDTGVIDDPLVGRRVPPADCPGGRGIWLIMNQVSDLVEIRSGPGGTTVRIHMRR